MNILYLPTAKKRQQKVDKKNGMGALKRPNYFPFFETEVKKSLNFSPQKNRCSHFCGHYWP